MAVRILFVCLGNICRSPMAEFVMKKLVKDLKREDEFIIESAATSYEEIGNSVYPPAKRELLKHGITCDGKRAVKLLKEDYSKYDYIIGMEDSNIRNMMRIFSSDPENKVKKLLDYTVMGGNIDDPWYTGEFDITYDLVLEGCKGLLYHIDGKNKA